MNNKLWEKSYPKQLKNYQLDESLLSGSVSEFCLYAAQHYQDQPAFSVVLPNGFSQSLSFKEIHCYSDHFANYLKHVLKLNLGDIKLTFNTILKSIFNIQHASWFAID